MTEPPVRQRLGAASVQTEHLRLLAKVARMYHERRMRQPMIAAELHISQSRVSRLLKQAVDIGMVRTVVTLPSGVYTDLEERLVDQYGVRDAVVVDTEGSSGEVIPALGAAAADYLHETLSAQDNVGISSWSATLLDAVEAMRPRSATRVESVMQLVGGIGDPGAQMQATRLLARFADITGARAAFMQAPGLVSSPSVQRALMRDEAVREVMTLWKALTVTVVGIGSLDPSPLLRRSGNAIAQEEMDQLRELGAVGDVCLRYYDEDGRPVPSKFDKRVIGIHPAQLMTVDRRVGVAGGLGKVSAIRSALLGGWINILVTDLDTAQALVASPEQDG